MVLTFAGGSDSASMKMGRLEAAQSRALSGIDGIRAAWGEFGMVGR
jgi:hypothetical protein